MKNLQLSIFHLCLVFCIPVLAQVQVDHPIQLTGTGANAKITGIQSVTNTQDAASAGSIQNGRLIYAMATGSGNNLALSLIPPISAYDTGMVFNFISDQNITGSATLNINNLGAVTITKYINQDLNQCDIQKGQAVTVLYDGVNFQMISAPVNVNGVPSVSIVANPAGSVTQGTSITFTATPTNGGLNPIYQWIINGGNVGTGGTTYTTSTLNNGDSVYCIMTTLYATCSSSATSNKITAQVTPSPLLTDLVAYWKLDESNGNPADASGNGHTLTNLNNCPFGTQYGVINNGVSFNGTDQDLNCSDAGFPSGTTDRTFAFWIKFTSTPVTGNGILTYGAPGADQVVSLQYGTGGSVYVAGYSDDADFYPGLSTGTWYHIAFTLSSTGSTITLYINGAQFGTSTGHAWNTVLNGTFYLGFQYFNNYYLPADMDEVGVWSRALSPSEISTLYNGGIGLQYPF